MFCHFWPLQQMVMTFSICNSFAVISLISRKLEILLVSGAPGTPIVDLLCSCKINGDHELVMNVQQDYLSLSACLSLEYCMLCLCIGTLDALVISDMWNATILKSPRLVGSSVTLHLLSELIWSTPYRNIVMEVTQGDSITPNLSFVIWKNLQKAFNSSSLYIDRAIQDGTELLGRVSIAWKLRWPKNTGLAR